MDKLTRHVGVFTLAIAALVLIGALVWQVIHGHPVDSLLAGLAGTTLGAFLPTPMPQRVTVDNAADDPVPVDPAA